jgi:hypothetical protein
LALVMPLLVTCSGTETVEPVNQAPTIEFTFVPIVVDYNQNPILTVAVSDPDDDPLTVTWDITSGQLVDRPSKSEKEWRPPRSVGMDTVTVRVSDGELSKTISETIKRGFRSTAPSYSTWTFSKDHSPWILDPAALTIPFGETSLDTIRIEPGVELYINTRDLAIEVLGTLESIGTQTDTILVRPNDRTLRCAGGRGWWEGFRVTVDGLVTGRANMRYTQVSYADKNIDVSQGAASARLQNCRFVCSDEAGVMMSSSGSLLVDNCDVYGNRTHGINVRTLATPPDSVVITNNLIKSNGYNGINLDLLDPAQSTTIIIEGNKLTFNSVHAIAMTHAVWVQSLTHNDFILNNLSNLSNIWLDDPYPGTVNVPSDWDTLLATDNYWGQAFDPGDIDAIEETIRDKTDNPVLGTYVIVEPWANTPQSSH